MIARLPNSTNPFSEYVRLLVELHGLIASGHCNSEPAEQLRDQMDVPWMQLSSEELATVDGLAADLNSFARKHATTDSVLHLDDIPEFMPTWRSEDWTSVLDLLRRYEARLLATEAAFVRGLCWAFLGEPRAAVPFLREALRLGAPDSVCAYEVLAICLIRADRLDEAMSLAEQMENDITHPQLMFKAAEVFAVKASQSGSTLLHRRSIATARRAIEVANQHDGLDVLSLARSYLHIALSHDQLDEREQALEACERALALDPNYLDALIMRGWLTYGAYPPSQKSAFREKWHRDWASESPPASLLLTSLGTSQN